MKKSGRQYKGMDVIKFVMALVVIVQHTHPFYGINDSLNQLTADVLGRIAVPFFFAAAGFLLEKKLEEAGEPAEQIIKNYLWKLLKLYLIWTGVYLPIIIYSKIICSERGIGYGIFTAIRDFIFCGSYAHLWYLPAAAVGVFLVFCLRKYIGSTKAGILFLLLFGMGLLTQSYFGILMKVLSVDGGIWKMLLLLKKIMVTCRNGIFFGGLFIYIGTMTAKRKEYPATWKLWTGFLVSLAALWLEIIFLHKYGMVREEDMYLMQIPTAYFLLCAAVRTKTEKQTRCLRRMSMNIYFVHMIFKFIYRQLPGREGENGMGLFLFTLAGTLITVWLMEKRAEHKAMKAPGL